VFDEHGNDVDTEHFAKVWNPVDSAEERSAYIDSYRKQIHFVTARITSLIETILEKSPQAPVIILQGDHGPASALDPESLANTDTWERLSILNALLIPGYEGSGFHERMTPVNTFRLVLNHCLQARHDFLDDVSFFSTWNRPLELKRVE
jgi:hypothetical protein